MQDDEEGREERRGEDACLEETEDVVSLGGVVCSGRRVADGGCEGGALTQCTVLYGGGEEGRRVYFFPEIKGGLVPVVGDIVEIELDDGPESVCGVGDVTVCDERVGVGDDGGRAEGRTVALRTTPRVRKGCFVCVKLGFAETTCRDGAARVGELLYGCLCVYKCVDEGVRGVLVDEKLESEGRIAGPSVEII